MFAMPGLRGFSLTTTRESDGVLCSADGVFIGDVPLLQLPDAENPFWAVRSIAELNKDLAARYRLPIDVASKAGALALIAAAFNRSDLAMAAIATVQMGFPDPPPLAKRVENLEEITARARELIRGGLLKFWDPDEHPRAGVPPNAGWFIPVSENPERLEPIPGIEGGNPLDKPGERSPSQADEYEGFPRGILELPLPGGWSRAPAPTKPPTTGGEARPKGPSAGVQPRLPFPGGLPQQRAPAAEDSPTKVPTRGGRLGNPPVRAQNAEIAADLQNRGYTITGGGGEEAEEYIPGAGPGTKGSTYVDITGVDETGGKRVRVQTVDTLADGVTPDKRERAAIARIQKKYPDDELWIIPKR